MSAICAGLSNKGKVGVQRGRETVGVPSFLPPRRAPQSPALRRAQLPAMVQRKTPRPSGTNTLAAVRVPRSAGAEKAAARQGRIPHRRGYGVTTAKQKHRRPPVRGVLFYSISSRTEKAASCSVLSSLYSISREYALQMQICAQCVTSPLASHSYTSSS